jgi:hypothetical protein
LDGLWLVRTLCHASSRARFAILIQRWRRYEFWPSWLFYLPLVPYLAYLSLRHRGMTTLTAVNPGIPQSGVVGESKFAILSQLPPQVIIPSEILPSGELDDRCKYLEKVMRQRGWTLPLVLKPDASQRGAGVRKIRDATACRNYLADHCEALLVQTYHPGPHEAGVFYYRVPGEETWSHLLDHGKSLSGADRRTDTSTMRELINHSPAFSSAVRCVLLPSCIGARSGPCQG